MLRIKSLTIVIALLVSTIAFSVACTPRALKNRDGGESSQQHNTTHEPYNAPAPVSNHDVLEEESAPVSAPKKAEKPKPMTKQYTVKKGDTLSELAKKFDTTTKELARINNFKNPNKIYAGEKILVPAQ